MADDKKDGQELSEDEKLAAEWEAAMEETGEEGAEESRDDEWAEAMEEAGESGAGAKSNVRTAPMEEFDEVSASTQASGPPPDLDVILDIPVSISMEVGNTQIPIRNLLQLNQGSVIELDRLAGEPLDVLVNGTLIAHGEVVMVNEKFGIRLTDVISPGERIKRLQK
ncbi:MULTISPECIES: flagellar motor switch protein FliN [unclassified Marinobacter]|uniref:flagellar motor switch protein FliN n=1 Tax=unclassified Marinobacter TaxID=83889 RepID=UPI0026E3A5BE|nr:MULTISPECIES: flagellar motor switch protein FliN [unclassified Marinobacter]MDO6440810.1 flagellar motor switch protein FliN [Marinobacter sp. 2_MG-2023]MDO6823638.1 flagellar motor switch protein FliN [Marinobacter sp. 1_MG-2023]